MKICVICKTEFIGNRKTCNKICKTILQNQTYKNTCLKRYGIENVSKLQSIKDKKERKGYWYSSKAGREFVYINNRIRKIAKPSVIKICKRKNCQKTFSVPYHQRKRLYCSKKCSLWDNRHGNSNIEKEVDRILDKLNINHIREYKIENGCYDFYLPIYNILLEVDGNYWHGKNIEFNKMNKIQQNVHSKDIIKNEIAKRNGYILYRIWEDEINEETIQHILNKENILW